MNEQEITLMKLQLINARDALYFAKLDHERAMAELKIEKANDEAHIVELRKTVRKLMEHKR